MLLLATCAQAIRAQAPTSQPSAQAVAARELNLCLRLIGEKKFDEARARVEPITAAHPDWSRPWLILAMTYHEEHRYGMAKPHFVKALELNPNEHAARPFFGWCLYYLGEADASREQFEAYLKVKPNYPDAIFAIGLIEYDRDELDKAKERFDKTIELARAAKDPRTEGKARARLADVYIRRGKLAEARDELLAAVKLRPDAYEAYFKLSRVYHRMGDAERAEWAKKMHDEIRERMHPTGAPAESSTTNKSG